MGDASIAYAVSPILTSLDEGPSRGMLLFGRLVEGDFIAPLQASIDSQLSIIPAAMFDQAQLDNSQELNSTAIGRIKVKEIDNQNIAYWSVVKDHHQKPVFWMEQIADRAVYQQGLRSIRNLILTIVLTGGFGGCIVMLLLEKNLLSRLANLHAAVIQYKNYASFHKTLQSTGQDELFGLSQAIDRTLQSLSQTQSQLNSHLKYEKLMLEISTRFINLPVNKIDQNLQTVLERVGEYVEADRCHILIFEDKNRPELQRLFEWNKAGVDSVKEKIYSLDLHSLRWMRAKLRTGKSVIIESWDDLPKSAKTELAFFESCHITTGICVPLQIEDELMGILTFERIDRPQPWDAHTPFLVEIIADIIASALDRKRNELRTRISQQFQYRLNQITKTGIEKDNFNSSIRALSRLLPSLIDSHHGCLVLTEPGGRVLIYDSGKRSTPAAEKAAAIQALIEQTTRGVYIHNHLNLSKQKIQMEFDAIGQSFIAVPLEAKNQRLGLIILAFDEEREFSNSEVSICQQAGSQITLSIIKIRALEEAQHISRDLSDLRENVVDISAELRLEKLTNTILDRAVKLLDADGGELHLYDEEKDELEVVAVYNLNPNYVGNRAKIGEGAAGRSVQLKKSLIIDDYSTWSHRMDAYIDSPVRATIVTPLTIGDRVIGCIGIFHITTNIPFTDDDRNLLTIFTQHAAIAIDNAVLFDRVQKMARMDEVTGLMNRRALNEFGRYEIERSKRLKRPIAITIIDLDNFKQINDTYTHLVGDQVLLSIARLFRENVRNIDIIGRFGGDEFVIIMPETTQQDAVAVAERIHGVLKKTEIEVEGKQFSITACFGISAYTENPPPLEKFFEEADTAMYAAKDAGRNRIRVFQID